MRITDMHVQMRVAHPQHGAGIVKAIQEQAAQVLFDSGLKTLEPGALTLDGNEALVNLGGGSIPLAGLVREAVLDAAQLIERLETERRDVVEQLGTRWRDGIMILKPADAGLQPKELPLERLFHKVVMVRDNLRVLEQKINSNPKLADAEKVELQQYITKCYGTMTSFNILFKEKSQQFIGSGKD